MFVPRLLAGLLAAALLASCGLLPDAPRAADASGLDVPAGVELTHELVEYPISGATASALQQAMEAQGLPSDDGVPSFGYTSWEVIWNYDWTERSDGACAIEDSQVAVEIVATLPRWDQPAAADADLVAAWRAYVGALELHERGHAQNAVDAADTVATALAELGPRDDCAEIEADADAEIDRILDAARAWDAQYDLETGHGATQGATWRAAE